jgi:hypothetical protein
LDIEIEQIERQILAADRRRDIALRELNSHQQQIENAAEVHDFLRDKFTKHTLYLWLQQETAAIYYQMYEMALQCARNAEDSFNFERGHTARRFIPAERFGTTSTKDFYQASACSSPYAKWRRPTMTRMSASMN